MVRMLNKNKNNLYGTLFIIYNWYTCYKIFIQKFKGIFSSYHSFFHVFHSTKIIVILTYFAKTSYLQKYTYQRRLNPDNNITLAN